MIVDSSCFSAGTMAMKALCLGNMDKKEEAYALCKEAIKLGMTYVAVHYINCRPSPLVVVPSFVL